MLHIKKYLTKDIRAYVEISKDFFPKHNLLFKPLTEVEKYIKKMHLGSKPLGGFFFAYKDDTCVGGALLRIDEEGPEKHIRFKYSHLTGKTTAEVRSLIRFFNDYIVQLIKEERINSAKAEVSIAKGEKGMQSYLSEGFVKEGELKSHYRYNEKVILLGKEFKKRRK
jgi:hypothetical protein